MRQCQVCEAELFKTPGPGRWPTRCVDCRLRKLRPRKPKRAVVCACGTSFLTHRATYCSTECRRSAQTRALSPEQEESRRQADRLRYHPRSAVFFLTCGICRQIFCARTSRAKVCRAEACQRRANADRMREYFRRIGGNRHRTTYPYVCADCGTPSRSESRDTERCASCANRVRPRRRKGKGLVHVGPPNFCPLPERHPARRNPPKPRTWYAGRCGHCGDAFVCAQPKTRYCSPACGRGAGKRRRGYFSPSPRARRAIYERDGWVCQLCFEPVDRDLHPSAAWAASLDHIRCQSWDEKPDHSPSNLRLAHRWCNSVRGDEKFYTAAILVA
jgi:hypothetical protein